MAIFAFSRPDVIRLTVVKKNRTVSPHDVDTSPMRASLSNCVVVGIDSVGNDHTRARRFSTQC